MEAPDLLICLAALVGAYVVGATPFGYLAGRMKGVDVRTMGSGNIGATNVIRVLGRGIGLPVFALDLLKGLVPVLVVGHWCHRAGADPAFPSILAALGSVLGHNFTFWLRFRGGKGIATSCGALLALMPVTVGVAALVWLAAFRISRYVAVASIAAALTIALVPAVRTMITGQPGPVVSVFAVVVGGLAIWRHRTNIRRLLDGTENRFTPASRREKSPTA